MGSVGGMGAMQAEWSLGGAREVNPCLAGLYGAKTPVPESLGRAAARTSSAAQKNGRMHGR